MFTFKASATNYIPFYASLSGVAVTGLTTGDVVVKYSLDGDAVVTVNFASIGSFTEIDDIDLPGHYLISLPGSVFSTTGVFIMSITGASFDTYNFVAYVYTNDLSGVDTKLTTIDTVVDANQVLLKVIRSLCHGQFKIESPVYDGAGNLTSCTLKGWDEGDDIDVDAPIITLFQTATYNDAGNMTAFQVTE